jgi:porin
MAGVLKSLNFAHAAGWAVLATALAAPAGAEEQNETGLLGAWGGLKPALAAHGVTLGISDSENLLGNVMGGMKTGATMQGVTTMTLYVDTGKAFGLQGGTFHVSALQLHGRPLSGPYLDNIQAANGNEGENATRLWELWYDQATPGGRFDLKIGQQSIDNEFMGSNYSALFVNTMAGWPVVPSLDLYGGGPAYPLGSLGVRGQYKPNDGVTILAGVFDDDPGGGRFDEDQQVLDPAGGRFNLNNGALWIAEIQYATAVFGLPGTYKFGGWYDSANFPDQRYDASHRGNYALYAVADQTVWHSPANAKRSLNLFGRIMGAPDDRNYIDFGFNGGLTLTAPFAGRDDDQAGLDFGVAHVSTRVADAIAAAGRRRPGTEYLIEATYQAQATSWLLLQPDLQYVIRPRGGIDDPLNPRKRLGNELVVGMRGVVTF